MRERVLIIGAGGHGKVVADVLRACGRAVAGFVDGEASVLGKTVAGLPVLGGMNRLEHVAREHGCDAAVVAIGDNRVRLEHAREVERAGLPLASAVHPSVNVAASAMLGRGVVICMGASVCAEATVGDVSIVNTNAVVDHECELGAAVHVCPGASLAGRVKLGEGAFVGIGASVIQCLSIGEWSIVGAGATVTRDVRPSSTVVGTPARERSE